MTECSGVTDRKIVAELELLTSSELDYWTFRGRDSRDRCQGLTQYPAMMVPELQAVLIQTLLVATGKIDRVCDPFVGSGTTLVESMRLGLDFIGQDINPLAILLCRVKSGPFHTRKLADSLREVVAVATKDRRRRSSVIFPGLHKWFTDKAIIELSRIHRAIRLIDQIWCRRVLWSALAETVRLTSNSRTSTFKLHIRSVEDLKRREVAPLETFVDVATNIVTRLAEEAQALRKSDRLTVNGRYRGEVDIRLGNSMDVQTTSGMCDLVVTSPPYGDNATTVPYGQYSFLPLQWIDVDDIDESLNRDLVQSPSEIDTRSVGGSKRNAIDQTTELLDVSPSYRETLKRLKRCPQDRKQRVAAFFRDLDKSLKSITSTLKHDGYMIWTVGNRRVGGRIVPTDRVLTELLAVKGIHEVARVDRTIHSKRMALRNSISNTMNREAILIFRKG